ncbi:hypothetical protein GQ55_6G043300 [Panicum hallii var. hallii]|uniref:Uncharacterized protein n=1 Tax=Panicum hallii var. hallii TaxID=1504633 RepID=A0A2T7D3R2_9POAL|nr:hypothetical protein GQ55_6G043300 [Panicum hallii var. hallii]
MVNRHPRQAATAPDPLLRFHRYWVQGLARQSRRPAVVASNQYPAAAALAAIAFTDGTLLHGTTAVPTAMIFRLTNCLLRTEATAGGTLLHRGRADDHDLQANKLTVKVRAEFIRLATQLLPTFV